MSKIVFDRVWFFVGIIVLGLLMFQSVENFTFGHFGFFLIFVGIALVIREELKEAKKKT